MQKMIILREMLKSIKTGLRLRVRQQEYARNSLFEAAFELFKEKGFEATTIDDIATAAGTSRRTFFRYFKTKDDVILSHLVDLSKLALSVISTRPVNEPPITSLRHAMQSVVGQALQNSIQALEQMARKTPSLRAAWLLQLENVKQLFAEELKRHYSSLEKIDVQIIASIAISIADMALANWIEGNNNDLASHIDMMFTRLNHLFGNN